MLKVLSLKPWQVNYPKIAQYGGGINTESSPFSGDSDFVSSLLLENGAFKRHEMISNFDLFQLFPAFASTVPIETFPIVLRPLWDRPAFK